MGLLVWVLKGPRVPLVGRLVSILKGPRGSTGYREGPKKLFPGLETNFEHFTTPVDLLVPILKCPREFPQDPRVSKKQFFAMEMHLLKLTTQISLFPYQNITNITTILVHVRLNPNS